MSLIAAILVLALIGAAWGALHYMTGVPGTSYRGALPPLTLEEAALAEQLKRHIAAIAVREHNVAHYPELENVARYIETALASYGYTAQAQTFVVEGKPVRNIEVIVEAQPTSAAGETIVVGAHYDSAPGTPGANDNATGTAAVIELARLLRDLQGRTQKRIRLVLFVNEEPPYFGSADMGSLRYARALAASGERVTAMYSLETIGFYSSEPGSQRYPAPFGLLFPDRADFVAFVGLLGSRSLLQKTVRSFRARTQFPSIGGVAPAFIPGIAWSDHWSFAQCGFPAIMITDTALFRYPHYHRASDTPDKIDGEHLARVAKGIERVIRDIAQ
jgi:Zn-dependent M28 family amino/carboxypeptidase